MDRDRESWVSLFQSWLQMVNINGSNKNQMDPLASIIILTYNNLEYTRQCLDSIFLKTAYSNYEVILVDNASTDGTQQYLQNLAQKHDYVKLILNTTNNGFAYGNNQGARAAAGEFLVFLNNDTIVTREWLDRLLHHLDDPQIGMIGPVTNSIGNESQIAVNYQQIEDLDAFAESYTSSHLGKSFEADMLAFFCVALRRQVLEQIGPLDERFGIGMFEDDDYALRMKQADFKICVAEDAFVHHWGSASFAAMDTQQYWQLFKQNLAYFEEKWNTRWLPPLPRPEFIAERLREDINAMIFFTDVVNDYRQEAINLRASNAELQGYKQTLESIYASNGWLFLQSILRIRSALIPEGSRRELLIKGAIGSIRDRGITPLRRTIGNIQTRPKINSKVQSSVQQSLSQKKPEVLELHFSWPLISVLLPIYNHANLLNEAANSVLSNTYPNFELIVLDDGSTDKLEPVLRILANNPRVRIFRQPNQKLPRALTHAHQLAQGEFITWTSADNRLKPYALEALMRELINHPEAALVYADVQVIDEQGKPLLDRSYRPQNLDPDLPDVVRLYQEGLPLGYETDNYINACFLYRKSAASALRFQYADDLTGLEDYDFWLRLQKTGNLIHLKNREPLYEYRVHEKTMSHELLTDQRTEHIQRLQKLIAYEKKRRNFVFQRWHLANHPSLSQTTWGLLQAAAVPLGVHLGNIDLGSKSGAKTIQFCDANVSLSNNIYARELDPYWELVWTEQLSQKEHSLKVWKGVQISPLALKARDHTESLWKFPQASNRVVVGIHADLNQLAIDEQAFRKFCASNQGFFFVFVGDSTSPNPEYGNELTVGVNNATYIGVRPIGEIYPVYASFDAFWLPPVKQEPDINLYGSLLALAFSSGKPFLYPDSINPALSAPFQYHYNPEYETLGFVQSFEFTPENRHTMDQYLKFWSPTGQLNYLLNLANAAIQESATNRPDFGTHAPSTVTPTRWLSPSVSNEDKIKCCLMVNALDRGGLEQVVADLTTNITSYGIDPFILCVESGGQSAENLKNRGYRVYIAEDNLANVSKILKEEAPHLVNSHWARQDALEIVVSHGIPVIENIHNMYVWLDESSWQTERLRSRIYTHAIAVSDLVKRYYLHNNINFQSTWVTITPNGILPDRITRLDRNSARRQLQIDENETLFLSLASYDGRKNQLGIISAFDQMYREDKKIRLILAGNIQDEAYFQQLTNYRDRLSSRNHIHVEMHRSDINLLLSASDAFVINSFFEGWSLAATEALVAGIPLIHSDCGSGRELVGENQERGVLIANPACAPLELNWDIVRRAIPDTIQNNTPALVAAMKEMSNNREFWRTRGVEIAEQSQQLFSFDKMLAAYSQLYRQYAVET